MEFVSTLTCFRLMLVHVTGETEAGNAEAVAEVTRDSQVNDAALLSEGDGNAAKSPIKPTTPAAAEAVNETPTLAAAGTSDQQNSENGLQSANRDANSVESDTDTAPLLRSEDARETTSEKSEGGSVSCVRDLINEAIEKTLQDPAEQCRSMTPPPSVGGQCHSCFKPFVSGNFCGG